MGASPRHAPPLVKQSRVRRGGNERSVPFRTGAEVLDVEADHVVVWIARRRYPNVEGLRRLREARPKGLGKYRVIRARRAAVPLPYLTTNICQRLAGPYRAKNRSLGKSDRNVDR